MDCITNIVGVSKSECPCIAQSCSAEQIAAMQISKSGHYLDEVEGGISFNGVKPGNSCKEACEIMLDQLKIAEKKVKDDVFAALSDKHETGTEKYSGTIGEILFSNNAGVSKRYAGIRIAPRPSSRDGVAKVRAISLMMDRNATIDLHVCRLHKGAEYGDIIKSYTGVSVAANIITGVNMNNEILKLPVWHNNAPVEYWFLYDRQASGVIPKNNKLLCNCGNQTRLLNQFVDVLGVEVESLTAMNASNSNGSFGYGLSLNVDVSCDSGSFVCREYDNKDAISVTLANAVLYKAAELVLERILTNPDVTRFTMQGREYLWGKRNHFKKEYDLRILYIIKTADISGTDCYICKSASNDIEVTGILS